MNARYHLLESTCSQVSKALCGKENASLDEFLQAVDQLKEAAMLEWLNPEIELPPDEDHAVLCCVNDVYGNTGFVNAVLLGFYYSVEGWILEQYPEWENPNVTHWMPLPKEPKED